MSKTNAGPLRLLQFGLLAIVAFRFAPAVASLFPNVWKLGSLLGRNSLVVFTLLAVVCAVGQILHRQGYHGVLFDSVYTGGALVALLCAAWLRERSKLGQPVIRPIPARIPAE